MKQIDRRLVQLDRTASRQVSMNARRLLTVSALLLTFLDQATAQTWTYQGPILDPQDTTVEHYGGILKNIAFHPTDPATFWVSGAGGLWKTTDDGITWTCLTDQLYVNESNAIAVNPNDPDSIFLVSGSNLFYAHIKLYHTSDGGVTWDMNALSEIPGVTRITNMFISSTASNVMVASTNLGIYRSTDNGITWEQKEPGFFRHCFQNPAQPDTMYADLWGTPVHFFRSVDAGLTWNETFQFPSLEIDRIEYAVSPGDGLLIQAVSSKTDQGLEGIYRSTDAGVSFTQVLDGDCTNNILGYSEDFDLCGGQAVHDLTIMIDPLQTDHVFVGGIYTAKSTDGGLNWTLCNSLLEEGVHPDQQMMRVNPLTQELFEVNDGGVYRSSDGGDTWTNASNGLANLQIHRIAVRNDPEERLIVGQQDNGIKFFRHGEWRDELLGDGLVSAFDPIDTNVFYSSVQGGIVRRTIDAGATFTTVSPIFGFEPFWTSFILDPLDHNSIYYAGSAIYVSHNAADDWEQFPNSRGNGPIAIAYEGATRHIWTIDYGGVHRTMDEGANWTSFNDTAMVNMILIDLAVAPYDPQKLWVVGYNQIAGKKVLATTDGGATWTNISGSLPNTIVNCVLYADQTNDGVFIGTTLGVFFRDNTMSDWVPYGNGMPLVSIHDLALNCVTQTLYAATYGRGIWTTSCEVDCDLTTDVADHSSNASVSIYPNPSNGQFTLSYRSIAPNSTFQLMDLSGRVVYTTTIINTNGPQPIGTSTLSDGVFSWAIWSNGSVLGSGTISVIK